MSDYVSPDLMREMAITPGTQTRKAYFVPLFPAPRPCFVWLSGATVSEILISDVQTPEFGRSANGYPCKRKRWHLGRHELTCRLLHATWTTTSFAVGAIST